MVAYVVDPWWWVAVKVLIGVVLIVGLLALWASLINRHRRH